MDYSKLTGYLFTKDHEWLKKLPDEDLALIGITDFAAAQLGELVFVDPPAINRSYKAGAVFCVVESTKAASDVYAPVDMEVIEVNSLLHSSPNLVNSAPFEEGYFAKVKLSSVEQLNALLKPAQYSQLLNNNE